MVSLLSLAVRAASVSLLLSCIQGAVLEMTRNKLKDLIAKKQFVLLYITKEDCMICDQVFVKFAAASQSLDTQAVFGLIKDISFARELGVTTFPSMGYFAEGQDEMTLYDGDITLGTIFELLSDVLHSDLEYVIRKPVIDLSIKNYDTFMNISMLSKLILLYEQRDKKFQIFERLAKIYEHDYEIMFGTIDVRREQELKEMFEARKFPAIYFYKNDASSTKFRYAGEINHFELKGYIEDRTGVQRDDKGNLPVKAGRIKELDNMFRDHIFSIKRLRHMKHVLKEVGKVVDKFPDNEFAGYYLYLLELVHITENFAPIQDEKQRLNAIIAEKPGPKTVEHFFKKRNIVDFLLETVGTDVKFKDTPNQSRLVMEKESMLRSKVVAKEKMVLSRADQRVTVIDEVIENVVQKTIENNTKKLRHIHLHEEL